MVRCTDWDDRMADHPRYCPDLQGLCLSWHYAHGLRNYSELDRICHLEAQRSNTTLCGASNDAGDCIRIYDYSHYLPRSAALAPYHRRSVWHRTTNIQAPRNISRNDVDVCLYGKNRQKKKCPTRGSRVPSTKCRVP